MTTAGCWRFLPGQEQRVTGSTQIAGEHNRGAAGRGHGAGRAQDVTCSAEGEMSTGTKVAALVVVQRLERGDRHLCVGGVVQRRWRVVPAEPPEAGVLGVFLQVGAVTQDDCRRRCRAWGAPCWPGEPLTHKGAGRWSQWSKCAWVSTTSQIELALTGSACQFRRRQVRSPGRGRSPPESFARRARAGTCCR